MSICLFIRREQYWNTIQFRKQLTQGAKDCSSSVLNRRPYLPWVAPSQWLSTAVSFLGDKGFLCMPTLAWVILIALADKTWSLHSLGFFPVKLLFLLFHLWSDLHHDWIAVPASQILPHFLSLMGVSSNKILAHWILSWFFASQRTWTNTRLNASTVKHNP